MSNKYLSKVKKSKSHEPKFVIFGYYECGDHAHLINDINGNVINVKVPREALANTIKFLTKIHEKNQKRRHMFGKKKISL